ncbi:MAG: adenosylcobalamin-dependent ribonucleoside-diphosphate reductase [Hyphomicrobium sp.]
MPSSPTFPAPISEEIWEMKYRFKAPPAGAGAAPSRTSYDTTLDDTLARVSRAAAERETGGKRSREKWADAFHGAMSDFGFLPGGRILAGAGTGRDVTLFNCFVMGTIEDDLGSIFENVREAALTMQQGGGIGHDFSTLRPKGALVKSIGADASGPVSFMDVWDAMCRTIMSAGARRGAMMGCLRCDHPDIELFIEAKADAAKLRNFNLSVLVTDAFMAAVREDQTWDLVFEGRIYRSLAARDLWRRIMRATYDYAEPGVIFIDRVNARNNLAYCEDIAATNPCGEQPLPPYGACLLGSINLAALVEKPFTQQAAIDSGRLEQRVATAVRFLDNVIDVSNYPLDAQRREAKGKRRIGLGMTGLANALMFSCLRYGTDEATRTAAGWMATIQRAAYAASAEIAAEKGAFPLYDADPFLARPNVEALDRATRKLIRRHGIRNGCLTTIAPSGTISLLAGNVSSGIEPVFDYTYRRRVLEAGGAVRHETVEDFAFAAFRRTKGPDAPLPESFVRAAELTPARHLAMQAALQPHVDSAISKTINCPEDIPFEAFESVYSQAYDLGLKGCTTYRPNAVTGTVLAPIEPPSTAPEAEPGLEPEPQRAPDHEPEPLPRPSAAVVLPVRTAAHAAGDPGRSGGVVYMSKPLERDPVLAGYTYKLKWPESEHAIYVTINDIEQDGPPGSGPPRRRPFEIFINTKNLQHYAWTVALTRMISAVFRRGGDVSFVAEELKAVFDPQGGRWLGGRYVPSLLAAIGDVIEAHMVRIGFIAPAGETASTGESDGASEAVSEPGAARGRRAAGRLCPRCSSASYVMEGGCWVCRSCGFSRCG